MKDPTSLLRSATRRAKSDVANKLISMFLHDLSRRVAKSWPMKVGGEEYEVLVRLRFGNLCPYCLCDLRETIPVVEHLDGMNRLRAGLHVPGNVLVACRKCNSEKRRDDCKPILTLADSGWESFLLHDGTRCPSGCATCRYWAGKWSDEPQRRLLLATNLERIRSFRSEFGEYQGALASLKPTISGLLVKLYTDCQSFAEREIGSLLDQFENE
jgi:hypothetical protein